MIDIITILFSVSMFVCFRVLLSNKLFYLYYFIIIITFVLAVVTLTSIDIRWSWAIN